MGKRLLRGHYGCSCVCFKVEREKMERKLTRRKNKSLNESLDMGRQS